MNRRHGSAKVTESIADEHRSAPRGERINEWFVPSFGPPRFRAAVGLLFLPYTGMVLAYTAFGSVLAAPLHRDRVAAILIIYFLALGLGAHALDALGSRTQKPWGLIFSRRSLWAIAAASLFAAYAIGIYYMLRYAPWLWVIALLEGFFLLAYNLEWWGGKFHTDGWFAFSWGVLPTLAGYVLQTNAIEISVVLVAAGTGLLSLAEIKASRPYKALKRRPQDSLTPSEAELAFVLEAVLKGLSLGVVVLGAGLLWWRW